jgi:hypothetical protein
VLLNTLIGWRIVASSAGRRIGSSYNIVHNVRRDTLFETMA